MKTKVQLVEFNTGKIGARFFDFNPFSFGWWYLYHGKSGKSGNTVGIAKLGYFAEDGIQFENHLLALAAKQQFSSQQKSTLKVVKEY